MAEEAALETHSRTGAIAYWALIVLLIAFGLLGILSIGLPFLLLGIALAILSRRRHETGVIAAGIAAIVGFALGYVLGINYSGAAGHDPSVLPGVIAGLVLAVLFANVARWLARRIAA